MRLLAVELDRFRARRGIALMLLGVALLVGWLTVTTIWDSRAVSSTDVAAAKEAAAQEAEFARQDYERCVADPEGYFGGDGTTAADCTRYEADYRNYLTRRPLSLEEERDDTGKAAVLFLAGISIIAGATFAGADWATGSTGNQLLFRPRRLQVWAAKGAAVALGATVFAAVVLAAQWGAYFTAAEARSVGHSPGFVGDLVQTLARGLALVGGGALGGFALTMLLRSTVGTLAVLFFYSIGAEALVAALPFERDSRWSLGSNVFAWLDDGTELYAPAPCEGGGPGATCAEPYTLALAHGATYLGVLLVLVVMVSAWHFHRRDVP